MTLIELGGGTNPHPRATVVIDLHHPKNAPAQDATVTPWMAQVGGLTITLPDGQADEVYASHFMEHIPRGQPLIDVMNEVHRVLKPGGTFTMILPLVGYTWHGGLGRMVQGWQPYADPTHVNYWWFPEGLLYFCDGPFKPHANYGICEWAALGQLVDENDPAHFQAGSSVPIDGTDSFWTVRGAWEGVARLVKPS